MKHSNLYTFTFIGIITIIASLLLALASTLLKVRQEYNVDVDKKKNILKFIGVDVDKMTSEMVINEYKSNINNFVLSLNGDVNENLSLNDLELSEIKSTGQQVYKISDTEYLPVYMASNPEALILPISGKGLWSTLYGYIALEKDFNTVKGITFYKHGETPGLGGEVEKPWFQNNFVGKKIFNILGDFVSIEVVKGKAADLYSNAKLNHAVDGISGATITSRGVSDFVKNDLERYKLYLSKNRTN